MPYFVALGGAMKIMNCCIVDCTEDRIDCRGSKDLSSAELLQIYKEDSLTDGVTPLISPIGDYAQDNEYVTSAANIHKRKEHSDEDSLTGAVATTYDEADNIDPPTEIARVRRASNLPKFKARRSSENLIETSEVVRNIFTARDGRCKSKSIPDFRDNGLYLGDRMETNQENRIRMKSGLQARQEWRKGA